MCAESRPPDVRITQAFTESGRLVVTIAGINPRYEVLVVPRVVIHGHPGLNLVEPVSVDRDRTVEFDLSALLTVVAWTPDVSDTLQPVQKRLPEWR